MNKKTFFLNQFEDILRISDSIDKPSRYIQNKLFRADCLPWKEESVCVIINCIFYFICMNRNRLLSDSVSFNLPEGAFNYESVIYL